MSSGGSFSQIHRESSVPQRLAVLLTPLFLFFAYGHVLYLPFGVMDDFPLLDQPGYIDQLHVQNSRPVYSALSWLGSLTVPPEVEWLFVYRMASVLCLMVMAVLISAWLRRLGWSPILSASAGLMVGCLAPMQVYASWAVMWGAPVAACLSAAALLIAFDWTNGGPPPTSSQAWIRSASALALLILALATYQPTGVVYFALLIPAVWGPATVWVSRKRAVLQAVGLGVAAMFAYALFAFVLQRQFGSSVGRALDVSHPVDKISWFISTVIPRAAELWRVEPGTLLGPVIVLIPAIAGAVQTIGGRRTSQPIVAALHVVQQVMAVGVLLTLSYAGSLMVAESWPSYRSQAALTTGLCLLFVTSVRSLALRLEAARALHAVSLVFVAAGLMLAARNTLVYYAAPQMIEWRVLKHELRENRNEILRTGKVHVIRPDPYQGPSPIVQPDEFGYPSLASPWVTQPMVAAALRTIGAEFASTHVTQSGLGESVPADGPIIDMRRLEAWR